MTLHFELAVKSQRIIFRRLRDGLDFPSRDFLFDKVLLVW